MLKNRGSLILASITFLVYVITSGFLLVPSLFRRIDEWRLGQSGSQASLVGVFTIAAGLLILFVIAAHFLAGTMKNRRAKMLFLGLFAATIVSISALCLSNWHSYFYAFDTSKKFVYLETNVLAAGMRQALEPRNEIELVGAEFAENKLLELSLSERVYPRNIYRVTAQAEQIENGYSLSSLIVRAAPVQSRIAWNVIDSARIERGADICSLYDSLSLRLLKVIMGDRLVEKDQSKIIACSLPSESYRLYLESTELYQIGKEASLDSAIVLLQLLLKSEPNFTLAKIQLANCYAHLFYRLWRPNVDLLDSALVALQTVANDAVVGDECYHRSHALYHQVISWHNISNYRFLNKSRSLESSKYLDSAIAAIRRSLSEYEKAEAQGCISIGDDNNSLVAKVQFSELLGEIGFPDSANSVLRSVRESFKKSIEKNPFVPALYANIGLTYYHEWGLKPNSDKSLLLDAIKFMELGDEYAVPAASEGELGALHYNLACLNSELGDIGESLRYLRQAIKRSAFNIRTKIAGDSTAFIAPDPDLKNVWQSGLVSLDQLNSWLTESGFKKLARLPFTDYVL